MNLLKKTSKNISEIQNYFGVTDDSTPLRGFSKKAKTLKKE